MGERDALEGLWQGFQGEWGRVSRRLTELAEGTPAGQFSWRPVEGVRAVSEIYMHIALANFYLLSMTGVALPIDLTSNSMEKTVSEKAEVIQWLTRSLEAVGAARAATTPDDLCRRIKILGRDATVDGTYLRIIVHANEHMGQLTAYARIAGLVPPWCH
jgi:uncharacterized damage-inducible protein DinB